MMLYQTDDSIWKLAWWVACQKDLDNYYAGQFAYACFQETMKQADQIEKGFIEFAEGIRKIFVDTLEKIVIAYIEECISE